MIERVLLIVNTESGAGTVPELGVALLAALRESDAAPAGVELALVSDHPTARRRALEFAAASRRPSAIIAGGGGGTVRAAVEGVFQARAERRTVLGALRLGSGNVLARRLGIARDPLAAARQLGAALRANRVSPVPVIRCEHGRGVRHAVVMCGLGQWGRTSGDLARWHAKAGRARAAAAAVAGIERVNHAEYVAAAAMRFVQSAVAPASCELVEVRAGETVERFRLLAGAAVTGPVPGLPVTSGVLLVPRIGRPRRFRLAHGGALHITLLDRAQTEFFLDEDPEVAHGAIALDLAGNIPFLTAEVAQ